MYLETKHLHGRQAFRFTRFASGETWRVVLRGATPPRGFRRVVVRSADAIGADLEVLAYVPGRRDLSLRVEDAHLIDR
jgi:hypothetical protein